jgi:hypothetical protein
MKETNDESLRGLTPEEVAQIGGGFGSIATGGTIITGGGIVAGGSAISYGFGGWPYGGYGYAGWPYGGYGYAGWPYGGYGRGFGYGWH